MFLFFHAVPTLTAMPSVVYVRDGSMVTLNCTPSDPRVSVTWFRGSVKITTIALQENLAGIKFGQIAKRWFSKTYMSKALTQHEQH